MEDREERRPGRQRPPSREQEAREEGQRGRRSTDGNRNGRPAEQEGSRERIGDGGEPSENPLKALKILYENAQSIVGKIGELTAVVQNIEPDLILLTETWCNSTRGTELTEDY
jgi:hypothetical protein